MWVTSPEQLRIAGISASGITENAVYRPDGRPNKEINLGWLLLEEKQLNERYSELSCRLGVPDYILERFAVLPDKLFVHVVNSGLEVRTSVSINPETGAAEERALFSYEALPRSTVLYWEIICKNPKHFRIRDREIEGLNSPDGVYEKTSSANPYLEHLGIGGMGTRGMGRLRVLGSHKSGCAESTGQQPSAQQPEQTQSPQQGGTP
jgi:CRISPR-associated protein Cmr4